MGLSDDGAGLDVTLTDAGLRSGSLFKVSYMIPLASSYGAKTVPRLICASTLNFISVLSVRLCPSCQMTKYLTRYQCYWYNKVD